MKTTTSLLAIAGSVALLLTGCQTPNIQSCGRYPTDYENVVHDYASHTFKDLDTAELRDISVPRQGSVWRGLIFGGAEPCWLVDVTLNAKNGFGGGYQTYTIGIKNDRVIRSDRSRYGEQLFSSGQKVKFEEISQMHPFRATVESITVDHPFFVWGTSVDIWLRKPDSKKCLVLSYYPANAFVVGFARSLREGMNYEFPKVFGDYVESQKASETNKVELPPHPQRMALTGAR
jgi:hypothetical protein